MATNFRAAVRLLVDSYLFQHLSDKDDIALVSFRFYVTVQCKKPSLIENPFSKLQYL
jgi:hypothetical protein